MNALSQNRKAVFRGGGEGGKQWGSLHGNNLFCLLLHVVLMVNIPTKQVSMILIMSSFKSPFAGEIIYVM